MIKPFFYLSPLENSNISCFSSFKKTKERFIKLIINTKEYYEDEEFTEPTINENECHFLYMDDGIE